MKRLLIIMIILSGCSSIMPLQRSKLITAFHLIEDNKFEEAKDFIEGMLEDEQAVNWPRTWHARGLLYQNAYTEGIKKNNRKLFEMIPRQLFVAYESYEKAISLNAGSRIRNQLTPKYVLLANDFQRMGQTWFAAEKYSEALEAFEAVEKIRQSELLQLETDTNLVYNIALSAIKTGQNEKAINYLYRLDGYNFGTNVSHLLYLEHLKRGDTLEAQQVLERGIKKYDEVEELILLLVELHFVQGNLEASLEVLDRKSSKHPTMYKMPFTRGLILQKSGKYEEAITAYKESLELEPTDAMIYAQIATCFYNIGIEIEEYARTLDLNSLVAVERAQSTAALESATEWLNKASELENATPEALTIISELSALLEMTERVNGFINPAIEN